MSDRYKGAILSPTAPTVTPQSAGGIYTSSQQLQYQGQGVWPSAVNYPINNSLRFRSSASAYLNRTAGTPTNNLIWTWSAWVKRGALSSLQNLFEGYYSASNWTLLFFNSDNTLYFYNVVGGVDWDFTTTAVFRDPSAWYHVVLAYDSTQATASNRVRIYVNGVEQAGSSPSGQTPQNQASYINYASTAQNIGKRTDGPYYLDSYLAEVNFIDGVQLTPSSFGTTDAYGIWQPIPYTGAYGNNGFYLPFTDNSALTTSSNVGLGKDFSGNGNYWVTNNISITAGSTYDSMKDVPTNTNSNTANYATLNPLAMYGTNAVISNANLTSSATSTANDRGWASTIAAPNSGKWYAEFTFTTTNGDNNGGCGVMLENGTGVPGESATTVSWRDAGTLRQNATNTSYGSALTANDVVIVAYDAASGSVWFGKNGTWFASGNPATNANPSATGITTSGRFATYHYGTAATIQANFGQRPFSYTPPSGFYPLNTYNLPTPTILDGDQYFNATLYTGNSTTNNIVNAGSMQPDLVWIKSRSNTQNNNLFDVNRGAGYALFSNLTNAEANNTANFTSFNSNGFSLASNGGDTNFSGYTYVAWQWRASNAAGVSNTQGTITSTVSANTTAGFSIVTYTGTGSAATVGHGLGVAPSMVIVKCRSNAISAPAWPVWHTAIPASNYLDLQTTIASSTASSVWNSTLPTSSVFSIGTTSSCNSSGFTYVAYCFSQVAGYSAFGSYTGNGSTDGPFVYLGFRPRYIMIKSTVETSNWFVYDTARDTYNIMDSLLFPSDAGAEYTDTGYALDALSNGFKIRATGTYGGYNNNGNAYIYACFAENPFKIARAR